MGDFNGTVQFEKIKKFVSAYFTLPVKLLPPIKLNKSLYNKQRRKFDADEILLKVRNSLPADAFAFAAITDKDMFSGRLSAVFGLAYCDLHSCVVSTARTVANPHQIKGRDEFERIFKLVVHELCHTMGFPHCSAHKCLMNGTANIKDVNNAPLTLCGPCLRKLQWNIGFDKLARYKKISNQLAALNISDNNLALAAKINRLEKEKAVNARLVIDKQLMAYVRPRATNKVESKKRGEQEGQMSLLVIFEQATTVRELPISLYLGLIVYH